MARLDQMIPVRMSTFSLWIILSAICTASSGFIASSSTTTSMSLLPDCLMASRKPSRTSRPRPAPPPESVVIMPTLTGSAMAVSGTLIASPNSPATIAFIIVFSSRWIRPDLSLYRQLPAGGCNTFPVRPFRRRPFGDSESRRWPATSHCGDQCSFRERLARLLVGSNELEQFRRPVPDDGLDVIAHGLGRDLRIPSRERVAHHEVLFRAGRQAGPVVRRHAQGAVAEGVAMHMQRASREDWLERREPRALEDGEVELAVELAQGIAVVADFGFGDFVDDLVEASEVGVGAGFGRAAGALGLKRDADARHLRRFLQRGGRDDRPVIAAACDQSVLLEPQ